MNPRLALCALAATLSPSLVHADSYHAVEAGETLASVAARYKLSPDALRTANRLTLADSAPLGAMLLRVPDGTSAVSVASRAAISAPVMSAPAQSSFAGSGSITKTLRYTVEEGDTVEGIAARHTSRGFNVSPDSIRTRNNLSGQPTPGSVLTIPLQTTVYRAPEPVRAVASSSVAASGFRTVSSDDSFTSSELAGGAQISGELPMPTARELPSTGTPVYQAPNAGKAKVAAQRGPTSLSSRSYSPIGDTSGVRVLGPREEAPNVGNTPSPRVRNTEPVIAPSPTRIATVAKVAMSGARIRRLPDSDAATLYRCATGTEIAVLRQTGAWSAILMSDKSTGWMPTRYLRMSPQQVDISSIPVTEGTYARRANRYAYTGNFSSSNPMVAQALTWLGTPYVYGGTSRRGIDCSALVQTSFRACGYNLPRTAAQQSKVGQRVDPSDLRAGDRLYFSASGTRIDHTGLYMGNGLFVQASGSGRAVIVSNLFDSRNWNIFVGARR
jgi:cell wall-associated NlpC family hydrolase